MRRKLFAALSTVSIMFAGLLMLVSPAQALTLHGNGYVFDNFSNLVLRPDEDAYWYALNWGQENGDPQIWNDRLCGDGSCFEIKGPALNKYLQLQLKTTAVDGYYNNAELAERNTGFATTEPGKYVPTAGHPVLINAKVRWGANYNVDGSGPNVGSTGVWLWNSPYDDATGVYGYTEAFGFVLAAGEDNPIIPGFAATQSGPSQFPNYVQTIRDVNIHDWVLLTMKWSTVNSTTQKVEYFVNLNKIGETSFDSFNALDLEIWNDNQTLNTETFEIEFPSPVADQHFDIDFVNVVTL